MIYSYAFKRKTVSFIKVYLQIPFEKRKEKKNTYFSLKLWLVEIDVCLAIDLKL